MGSCGAGRGCGDVPVLGAAVVAILTTVQRQCQQHGPGQLWSQGFTVAACPAHPAIPRSDTGCCCWLCRLRACVLQVLCTLSFPLCCKVAQVSANVGGICYKASAALRDLPWWSWQRLGGGQEVQRLKSVCLGSLTMPGQRSPCDSLITRCLFGLFEGRHHA